MSGNRKSWNHKTISRVKNLTYQLEPRAGQWLVYPEGKPEKVLHFEIVKGLKTAQDAAESFAGFHHRREIEDRIRQGLHGALFGKGLWREELTENPSEYRIVVLGVDGESRFRIRVDLVAVAEVLREE